MNDEHRHTGKQEDQELVYMIHLFGAVFDGMTDPKKFTQGYACR